jgi:hypothetical protein
MTIKKEPQMLRGVYAEQKRTCSSVIIADTVILEPSHAISLFRTAKDTRVGVRDYFSVEPVETSPLHLAMHSGSGVLRSLVRK